MRPWLLLWLWQPWLWRYLLSAVAAMWLWPVATWLWLGLWQPWLWLGLSGFGALAVAYLG